MLGINDLYAPLSYPVNLAARKAINPNLALWSVDERISTNTPPTADGHLNWLRLGQEGQELFVKFKSPLHRLALLAEWSILLLIRF